MGLGVAPSAWPTNADSTALQIGTGFAAFGRGSGDEDRGGIAVNYYTDGSANYYIGNGNANRIYMNDGNIDFQYASTNSSGAGQALTFSSTMRIASDGEVFIGDGLGTTDRNTVLSVSGANVDPGGAWSTMGIYSSDSQAENKGGSLLFGGQDGSTTKQYFAGISGVKESSTSGAYAGRMRFWTRPAGDTPKERLRITSAGNVNIRTDDVTFGGIGTLRINSGSTTGALNLDGGASNHGGEINLLGGSNGGRILFRTGQGSGQQSEVMRLTENGQLAIGDDTSVRHSGRFQVINTSVANETGDTTCFIESSGNDWLMTFNDTDASSSTEHFLYFNRDGTNTGSVYSASGTTTYATSSDYRLQENVVSITSGISRLKNLKPKRFNFIEFPDKTQDGFLAHEVQEVVPEAASGEKDEVASKNEYNHKVGEAVYQTLDNAKLVPLLTAALQEAISKIETLETKLSTLESTIKSSSSFVKLKSSL